MSGLSVVPVVPDPLCCSPGLFPTVALSGTPQSLLSTGSQLRASGNAQFVIPQIQFLSTGYFFLDLLGVFAPAAAGHGFSVTFSLTGFHGILDGNGDVAGSATANTWTLSNAGSGTSTSGWRCQISLAKFATAGVLPVLTATVTGTAGDTFTLANLALSKVSN